MSDDSSYSTQWENLTVGSQYDNATYSPSSYSAISNFQNTEAANQITAFTALQQPAPTTGEKPMSYYGGNYSGYTPYSQQVTSYDQPQFSDPGTPSSDTPALPDYVYQSPTVEQVTSTGYIPPSQQVQLNPGDIPVFNTPGDFSSLEQTPTLPNYGQSGAGGGSPPPGGQTGGGGSSGGGQGPQPQQKQQPQSPINIFNILGKSGSGQAGGNTGALYNPNKQGGYGAGNQYGSQSGANAGAGYNAPSIVPYLLIGGLGLLAYEMLKGKHHG